jgi:hypothetical protein
MAVPFTGFKQLHLFYEDENFPVWEGTLYLLGENLKVVWAEFST